MSLTITAVPSWSSVPRVRLDVDSSAFGASPSIRAGSPVQIFRVHADGSRYRVLTELGARLTSTAWAGFDYHCPFNQPVKYQVSALSAALGGGYLSSALSGATTLVNTKGVWLIHPTDPALTIRVDAVLSIADRSRVSQAARFDVFKQPAKFITGGKRQGITGSTVIRCDTPEAEQPLMDLLEDDGLVLVNTPGGSGWDLKWLWVKPFDDTYNNPAGFKSYPYRHASFGFEATDQPDLDLEPTHTYADTTSIKATYGTTMYSTFENRSLDVRV